MIEEKFVSAANLLSAQPLGKVGQRWPPRSQALSFRIQIQPIESQFQRTERISSGTRFRLGAQP